MRMIKQLFAAGAGIAAIAAAGPAMAQYYGYNYNNYGYQNQNYDYSPYGQGYAVNTSAAASQCTTAVNNRLYTRRGLAGVIGSLFGAYATTPQVISVTRVSPNGYGGATVHGIASSGRYAYNQADLSFRCSVDASGYVRGVSINRRY